MVNEKPEPKQKQKQEQKPKQEQKQESRAETSHMSIAFHASLNLSTTFFSPDDGCSKAVETLIRINQQ